MNTPFLITHNKMESLNVRIKHSWMLVRVCYKLGIFTINFGKRWPQPLSYLQNRSPHKALGLNTPYAMWFGHKPNLSHLPIFGVTIYNYIPQEKRRKLYPHARKGTLVGYGVSTGVQAYNLFNLKTRKILFSQSVTFDEEGLLLNLPTMVQYSHQNINTNLLMPLDILIRKEYKCPITSERVWSHTLSSSNSV